MQWTYWLLFFLNIIWNIEGHILSHQYLRLSIKTFNNKLCIAYYRKTKTVLKCQLLMPCVAFNILKNQHLEWELSKSLTEFLLIYLVAFQQHDIQCLLHSCYSSRCRDPSVRTLDLAQRMLRYLWWTLEFWHFQIQLTFTYVPESEFLVEAGVMPATTSCFFLMLLNLESREEDRGCVGLISKRTYCPGKRSLCLLEEEACGSILWRWLLCQGKSVYLALAFSYWQKVNTSLGKKRDTFQESTSGASFASWSFYFVVVVFRILKNVSPLPGMRKKFHVFGSTNIGRSVLRECLWLALCKFRLLGCGLSGMDENHDCGGLCVWRCTAGLWEN